MTQAGSSQNLRLQVISMQVPDVAGVGMTQDSSSFTGTTSTRRATSSDVVAYPGELAEILVRLENIGRRAVQLSLQVEGDFPLDWCRLGSEGHDLFPGQNMEVVLYFHVPADFYETPNPLRPTEPVQLDYQGRVFVVYSEITTGTPEAEGALTRRSAALTSEFNLYVRPRSLYLNYLPAIYGETEFMDRFLKIFEQSFEPIAHTYDALWAYLDPRMAPRSILPFLAHWVAWPIDNRWSLEQQRQLIRYAIDIYRWRGTRFGLRLNLHLYTGLPLDEGEPREADKHISIEELTGQGFVLGEACLGPQARIGGGLPYHFIVRLRPQRADQIDEGLVRLVIDREKPAYCSYDLIIDSPEAN